MFDHTDRTSGQLHDLVPSAHLSTADRQPRLALSAVPGPVVDELIHLFSRQSLAKVSWMSLLPPDLPSRGLFDHRRRSRRWIGRRRQGRVAAVAIELLAQLRHLLAKLRHLPFHHPLLTLQVSNSLPQPPILLDQLRTTPTAFPRR